jgi:Protein of unknown function (DUF3617)
MLSKRLVLLAYCLGAAAAVPALAADNTPLNVKPGLWEMTSDSEHSGTPPIPPEALATLTPEQRAKLEAAMQQSMGPQHRVMKHCVTQADIDNGFGEIERMGHGKCTQKVASSTSTLRAGTFSCTGAETMSGTYRFEAPSPEAMVAHWDMTMSNGDKAMQMKSVTQGKWLGADCGDLKPKD